MKKFAFLLLALLAVTYAIPAQAGHFNRAAFVTGGHCGLSAGFYSPAAFVAQPLVVQQAALVAPVQAQAVTTQTQAVAAPVVTQQVVTPTVAAFTTPTLAVTSGYGVGGSNLAFTSHIVRRRAFVAPVVAAPVLGVRQRPVIVTRGIRGGFAQLRANQAQRVVIRPQGLVIRVRGGR